jgi:protein CpxP
MNFFRRSMIVGTTLAALGGFALKAHAHGGWRHGGWRHGEPLSEARIDKMLQHLYIEIEATEEQKQKLTPIVKGAAKDLLPLRERIQAARRRGLELLASDRVDRGALEALRGEQIGLADEASRRLSQALADAAEVLTAEQRRGIAQRLQRRMRGWV